MSRLRLPGEWQRCATAFLQSILDRSGSDESLYSNYGVLCRFFESGIHPGDVTKTDILTFVQSAGRARGRVGRPVAPATKNRRLATLTMFYTFASAWTANGTLLYTKALPTTGIAYSQPDIVYKALSEQELERFFAAIPDTPVGWRDRALFLCYFWTARRKSELARLRWKDIEPAVLKDEHGGRPGFIYRYQGKGRSRETKAKELPAPAYQALMLYLTKSGRVDTIKPDDPLFVVTKASGKHARGENVGLNASYINLQFKRYARLAGLDSKFSLHSLRHSSAHERDQAGQKLFEISETLDHANVGTTFLYLRRMSGTADNGSRLLAGKFGSLGVSD